MLIRFRVTAKGAGEGRGTAFWVSVIVRGARFEQGGQAAKHDRGGRAPQGGMRRVPARAAAPRAEGAESRLIHGTKDRLSP